MANNYETLIALNPNLEKEGSVALIDGIKEIIVRHGGKIITERDMGKKKFAYTVKKFSYGCYYLLCFSSQPETISEIERFFKHSEDVLKYLTLRLDEKELEYSLASLDAIAPVPQEKENENETEEEEK